MELGEHEMRNMESLEYQQLSLFENHGDDPMKAITVSPVSSPSQVSSPLVALRSDSKQAVRLFGLESWMKKLVPAGEYVLLDGQHPQVLKPTLLKPENIPSGHHFYHYLIGSKVYSGVYVMKTSKDEY